MQVEALSGIRGGGHGSRPEPRQEEGRGEAQGGHERRRRQGPRPHLGRHLRRHRGPRRCQIRYDRVVGVPGRLQTRVWKLVFCTGRVHCRGVPGMGCSSPPLADATACQLWSFTLADEWVAVVPLAW